MDLLDRYIYDVGRRLPAKQREDIKKELKSLLMDALDAKTGGREPAEADVMAVIWEFGQPADVAARYNGEKSLIGPRLFPTYKLVLTIVLAALSFGLFISMAMGYAFGSANGANLGSSILQFLASLISSGWGTIGVITVVFWVIERVMERQGRKGGAGADVWDPKTLPPVPKHKDTWKPAESVVSIVFIIIALVLFNAFPDLISVYGKDAGGQWQHFQILSRDALAAYLPYWNIGLALSLAFHAVLLAQGGRRLGTNIAHIALQLYGIAVVCVMLTGPTLLDPNSLMAGFGGATGTLDKAIAILNAQFYWIFPLIIVISAADIGKSIYRIVRDKP